MSLPSPLIRTAKQILSHGIYHSQNRGHLDNILAVVHSDNAIELLLKDKARIRTNIEHTQIPTLLSNLQHDAVVRSMSGDIRLVHAIRNSSYHVGTSADVYAINFVIETAKNIFSQYGLYPDGGERQDTDVEAKGIMAKAIEKFTEAKLEPEKEGLYSAVVLLCAESLEKILRHRFERIALESYGGKWIESFPNYGSWNVGELAQIMWEKRVFSDPVLMLDLESLLAKRNMLVHAPSEIGEKETHEILQHALHFAFSTQPYFEMVRGMVMEDAVARILKDYNIPFEQNVEFRLGKQLFSSFDFVIPNSEKPVAILETKLERIRSDYFKAMLFDADLLRRKHPLTKLYIMYSRERIEQSQLAKMQEISSGKVDGLFDISEMATLLDKIRSSLGKSSFDLSQG